VNIDGYMETCIDRLKQHFGVRLIYVGLQGSYLRGEATESSDIDVMAVIAGLSVQDLDDYRAIIQALPYADRSCGFICSRQDLACWNPLEIAHLVHSTRDYVGTLCDLVPKYTREDVRNFVRMSLNNLYHELCHRRVHRGQARSLEALPAVYKGVFFILQDLHYLRTGVFIGTKAALLEQLQGKDRDVLACALALSCGGACDLEASFEQLFAWCQEALKSLAE